ncbi:TetR/AcrR family transcriptional regulator C-terminal domain-containing protein [Psychromicrobium lacuslunae]|uniref:TetR/AcrR family transcriptional regulator C-terminal domain-containing protein n=1 Tax=Psychromicrobium lacuslunae TaxID=1618207 RepID=UPI0006982C95|nr:TetR/AcrR family transcriptional regulator C-terminal domain-containing protein [Psychromicrobium lacuslunae]
MAKPSLSSERIVAEAFAILAESGLDGITARALAQRLQVQAGALYYHVPDMGSLADLMATEIMRELLTQPIAVVVDEGASQVAAGDAESSGGEGTAPGGLGWRQLLWAMAQQTRSRLLAFRDGAKLVSGTRLTDDSLLAGQEEPLRILKAAGFSLQHAIWSMQTVYNFVIGFVIEEQHRDDYAEAYSVQRRGERISTESTPLTGEANEYFLGERQQQFDFAINCLLIGFASKIN